MAVKKKVVAKKAVSKKAVAKKTTAKKTTAKKTTAKKTTAKKTTAKKTTKKAVAKKAVAKKTAAKKTTKKAVAKKASAKKSTTKKAAAKRVVKKASVKAAVSTKSRIEIAPPRISPPVLKPVATPSQGTSGRVVFLVIAGIVILGAIVWSKSVGTGTDDDSPTPAASISQSAEPMESANAEPTESAAAIASVESPTKFVAIKSAEGLTLRWVGSTATEGLTGYNVEIRANGVGDWSVIATVPADQLIQEVTKSSDSGWTQFRVSSVYSDGQIASASVFGIPGEFM